MKWIELQWRGRKETELMCVKRWNGERGSNSGKNDRKKRKSWSFGIQVNASISWKEKESESFFLTNTKGRRESSPSMTRFICPLLWSSLSSPILLSFSSHPKGYLFLFYPFSTSHFCYCYNEREREKEEQSKGHIILRSRIFVTTREKGFTSYFLLLFFVTHSPFTYLLLTPFTYNAGQCLEISPGIKEWTTTKNRMYQQFLQPENVQTVQRDSSKKKVSSSSLSPSLEMYHDWPDWMYQDCYSLLISSKKVRSVGNNRKATFRLSDSFHFLSSFHFFFLFCNSEETRDEKFRQEMKRSRRWRYRLLSTSGISNTLNTESSGRHSQYWNSKRAADAEIRFERRRHLISTRNNMEAMIKGGISARRILNNKWNLCVIVVCIRWCSCWWRLVSRSRVHRLERASRGGIWISDHFDTKLPNRWLLIHTIEWIFCIFRIWMVRINWNSFSLTTFTTVFWSRSDTIKSTGRRIRSNGSWLTWSTIQTKSWNSNTLFPPSHPSMGSIVTGHDVDIIKIGPKFSCCSRGLEGTRGSASRRGSLTTTSRFAPLLIPSHGWSIATFPSLNWSCPWYVILIVAIIRS